MELPPLTREFFGHSSAKHLLEAASSTAQLSSLAGEDQGDREGEVGWMGRDQPQLQVPAPCPEGLCCLPSDPTLSQLNPRGLFHT